ncbi:ATP12 family chaperone protein [Phenylobacterium sp.]|uniref:ATP12 family chaperone protein n=1 Tax=Phenylobacterium sp. TaxID=1871053 RepID=UPI002C125D8D|nr:ATP12 family protein [Phenylobacterium sp.]HLZ77564.1 ATP12 family protein [Phenylobacterium sp.]
MRAGTLRELLKALARGFHEPGDKPRRFYAQVSVAPMNSGFTVLLDARALRGPKGEQLVLPTKALAELVAQEWAAQGESLALAAMHATRLANTAIESVPKVREATAQEIADYAGSDLLCYYATAPAGLLERQQRLWIPVLEEAQAREGLRFIRAAGIVHQVQPPETLAKVKALALDLDDFSLTGLAFGAALFGSAVLALAVQRGWLNGEAAFGLSRLDEAWQEEKWGVDEEAAERTLRLAGEAAMLQRWFEALAGA